MKWKVVVLGIMLLILTILGNLLANEIVREIEG